MQFARESRHAKTLPDKREHLQLAIAQRSHLTGDRLDDTARQIFQKSAANLIARMQFAVQRLIEHFQNLGNVILCDKVTTGTGAESALHRQRIVAHGEHDAMHRGI